MNDPRIQPLLKAAQSFDRPAEGFTPKPRAADVRWELRPTAAYDATLHITAKTARTVAFRRLDSGWSWIGDQEIFDGPKMVKTEDGQDTGWNFPGTHWPDLRGQTHFRRADKTVND